MRLQTAGTTARSGSSPAAMAIDVVDPEVIHSSVCIRRIVASRATDRLGAVPSPSTPADAIDDTYTVNEIALANRNKGMPLDLLRHDITPVGAHYLQTHFDIPYVDASAYQLRIDGLVESPQSLSLAELQAGPAQTLPVTLECAGNGRSYLSPRPTNMPWRLEAIGTAEWTGVPLREVIATAVAKPGAVELVFTGLDEGTQKGVRHFFQRSLTMDEIERPEIMLAWAMNGRPLEPQHGAPLRLIVPGWYGMASVKWLSRIEAVAEPFGGLQQVGSYNIRKHPEDPGERVTRIRVRALMTPPGRPDFPTLERVVDAGPMTLRGRAWSGEAPVVRVEVGIDGRWADARLDEPLGDHAWRGWSYEWDATPGAYELSCRATDGNGRRQPFEQDWNVGGYCNNTVQRIRVTVENQAVRLLIDSPR